MKDLFSKFFRIALMGISFFSIFGVIVVLFNIYWDLSDKYTPLIAHGTNYIYVPILIFLGFCYWQFKQLREGFIFKENSVGSKIVKGIFALSIGIACFIILTNVAVYFGPEAIRTFAANISTMGTDPPHDAGILRLLLQGFWEGGIIAGIIFAFLFYLLRFGLFTAGLAISITIHNCLNGLEFDLSTLYDLVLEISMPEWLGTLITIGKLILSYYLGKPIGFQ